VINFPHYTTNIREVFNKEKCANILLYSYNGSQQFALFLNFILITLQVSDRLTVHDQGSNTVFTATGMTKPVAINIVLRFVMMDSKSVRNM